MSRLLPDELKEAIVRHGYLPCAIAKTVEQEIQPDDETYRRRVGLIASGLHDNFVLDWTGSSRMSEVLSEVFAYVCRGARAFSLDVSSLCISRRTSW